MAARSAMRADIVIGSNVGREIARVLGADRKENGYMTGILGLSVAAL